jgi:predicted small secreted protein
MKKMRTSLLIILVAISCMAMALAGCRTTKGFGEDVEQLGENIQGD